MHNHKVNKLSEVENKTMDYIQAAYYTGSNAEKLILK